MLTLDTVSWVTDICTQQLTYGSLSAVSIVMLKAVHLLGSSEVHSIQSPKSGERVQITGLSMPDAFFINIIT